MSVYVDALRNVPKSPFWKYGKACHMLADSEHELHEFAARIGLKRDWFQPKSSPHYDLTEARRRKAVALGAIQIGRREVVELIRQHREDAFRQLAKCRGCGFKITATETLCGECACEDDSDY